MQNQCLISVRVFLLSEASQRYMYRYAKVFYIQSIAKGWRKSVRHRRDDKVLAFCNRVITFRNDRRIASMCGRRLTKRVNVSKAILVLVFLTCSKLKIKNIYYRVDIAERLFTFDKSLRNTRQKSMLRTCKFYWHYLRTFSWPVTVNRFNRFAASKRNEPATKCNGFVASSITRTLSSSFVHYPMF